MSDDYGDGDGDNDDDSEGDGNDGGDDDNDDIPAAHTKEHRPSRGRACDSWIPIV